VISILTQIIVIMIFFHNRSTLLIVAFRTETLSSNPVLHQRNRPGMISETVNQQDPSNRCFSQLPNFPNADGCSLSICARPECWMRPNWCNEAISLRSWAALLSKQEQGCREFHGAICWSALVKSTAVFTTLAVGRRARGWLQAKWNPSQQHNATYPEE
jgi:hypothetical protein